MATNFASLQKDLRYNNMVKGYILDISNQDRRALPLDIMELDCLDEITTIRAGDNRRLTSIPPSFDFSTLPKSESLDE